MLGCFPEGRCLQVGVEIRDAQILTSYFCTDSQREGADGIRVRFPQGKLCVFFFLELVKESAQRSKAQDLGFSLGSAV